MSKGKSHSWSFRNKLSTRIQVNVKTPAIIFKHSIKAIVIILIITTQSHVGCNFCRVYNGKFSNSCLPNFCKM